MASYNALANWYDQLTEDVDYDGLHEYIIAITKRRGIMPRRVLDVACGTGSLSILFSRHVESVIGVDLSPEMIARAKQKAEEEVKQPIFVCADMASFVPEEKVDLITCMLDSFNYLTTPEKGHAALSCFSEALADGGILVFDIRPLNCLREFDGQIFMDENEDVFCVWRTEFHEEKQLCYYGMDIFVRQDDVWKRHQEEHVELAYSLEWIHNELELLGFTDVEYYGERTFMPPQPDEERIFIVARKKERDIL